MRQFACQEAGLSSEATEQSVAFQDAMRLLVVVRERECRLVEGIDGKRVLLVSRDSQQQYYL